MIKLCFCYNADSELLKGAVQKEVAHYPEIAFEAYNEDIFAERKKSFAVKSHFAARKTPFCGVFEDDEITKGFYTEAKQCTEQQIANYLFDTYAATKIDLPDVDESTAPTLDMLINNYKQIQHNE